MRKPWLFIVLFLLMHCVAFAWKTMPMSEAALTTCYHNRWAVTTITCALSCIAGVLIAKEDD